MSLLTNSMGVEGTAEPAAVIKAVEDAGYGASVRGQEAAPAADAGDAPASAEGEGTTKRRRRRRRRKPATEGQAEA